MPADPADVQAQPRRLLIPINDLSLVRDCLSYAIRRQAEGNQDIEVCLLHVIEAAPAAYGGAGYARELADAETERINGAFAVAVETLAAAGISCFCRSRSGMVVFSILDAAEEYACDEIVVPAPRSIWHVPFSGQVVSALLKARGAVPVVTVGRAATSGALRPQP